MRMHTRFASTLLFLLLFISASKEDGVDLLGIELVLVVLKEGSIIKSFEVLNKSEVGRISIGTPETVPVGKYEEESRGKVEFMERY